MHTLYSPSLMDHQGYVCMYVGDILHTSPTLWSPMIHMQDFGLITEAHTLKHLYLLATHIDVFLKKENISD